jgi:RHS repeat-associated protein
MANTNPLRYRGYYYDSELGMYYLQSRYYDPNTGRFLNADDTAYLGADGTPESYNLFAYCFHNIEAFTFHHPDPVGYFAYHREAWENSVLIMQDICCGVVPLGEKNRIWRQRTGTLAQYLSREPEQVSRIFCGLEQRLK